MSELANKTCIPCQGGIPPLEKEQCESLMQSLKEDWKLSEKGDRLKLSLTFDNFEKPMGLAREIGVMADEQWHHPELHIGYGHLEIEVWTHKIDGLVESDFIFAAKVDEIRQGK